MRINFSQIIIFLFVLAIFETYLFANQYSIEDDSLGSIPKKTISILKIFDTDYSDCEYIGDTIVLDENPQTHFWFITTKDSCGWGSALGPIWVLSKKNDVFNIVLSDGGYLQTIEKNITNNLYNIKTSAGTAGWYKEDLWKYNGKEYIKAVLKDNSNEKVLLSANLKTDNFEKKKDVLKVVELPNKKKKFKAYIKSLQKIEILTKEFSDTTEIDNLQFVDLSKSIISIFKAVDNDWEVKYCWNISTNELFFAAKKINSQKIYYSKNLNKENQCSRLLKN